MFWQCRDYYYFKMVLRQNLEGSDNVFYAFYYHDLCETNLTTIEMPKTFLQVAVAAGEKDLVESFLGHTPDALVWEEHSEILFECLQSLEENQVPAERCLQIFRLLEGKGADINSRVNGAQIPFAVYEYGNLPLFKYLLSIGMKCDQDKQPWYYNILGESVTYMNRSILEYIVRSGLVNINKTDEEGRTALFYAVQACNYKIVKKLIELGADPNIGCGRSAPLVKAMSDNIYHINKSFKYLLHTSSFSSILHALKFARKLGAFYYTKQLLQHAVMYHGLDFDSSFLLDFFEESADLQAFHPRYDPDCREFLATCVQEVKIFKEINVIEHITLHDVLIQITSKDYTLLKNRRVTNFLYSLNLSRFSNTYTPIFHEYFSRGKVFLALVDDAVLSLTLMIGLDRTACNHISDNIIQYLAKADLKNLVCLLNET